MIMLSRRSFLTSMMAATLASGARAQPTPLYYTDNGAAIGGYDVVSYFAENAPLLGLPGISVMWKGAVWRFASQQNRDRFESNPRAFAPQFGGYCAYAVSRGYLTSTDPNAWQIVDSRLYLTHSLEVERMWREDMAENIHQAEVNWPDVLYK